VGAPQTPLKPPLTSVFADRAAVLLFPAVHGHIRLCPAVRAQCVYRNQRPRAASTRRFAVTSRPYRQAAYTSMRTASECPAHSATNAGSTPPDSQVLTAACRRS